MVVKARNYADKMGWNRFVALQNYYSIAGRDIEREIVPMALGREPRHHALEPLAGGFLSGKFNREILKAGNSWCDEFDFPPVNKGKKPMPLLK